MLSENKASRWIGLALFVGLVLLPFAIPPFQLYFVTLILVYVIVAVGLNIVMGYAGQISVAHAAFMGVGAYVTALVMAKFGLHSLPALVCATVVSAGLGFLVGVPALRIRGHYLALATLAFQFITETIIISWTDLTGGPRGLKVPSSSIGPWSLEDLPLYYFVLVFAVGAFLFSRNLLYSRIGRAFISIRDHEVAAQVMGVNLTWYKTLAFGLSAAYAGLAGGLFAVTVAFLDPLAFTVWESVKHLIMVILGGLGTVMGPVIGAALIASAPELLREFREYSLLIYYAILIVLLLFIPGGLISGINRVAAALTPKTKTKTAGEASAGLSRRLPHSSSQATTKSLLDVSGIRVQFGGLTALRDATFTVEAGKISGLIGPNGAGKTTLFNVLTRVYEPTEGNLRFNGQEVLGVNPHDIVGLGMSRTFQNVEMFGTMTVLENVLVGMHHTLKSGLLSSGLALPSQQREEREARAKAMEILGFLDLEGIAHAKANELPLGTQRRVELARALAARPLLLLLDEPASGLSHAEAERLMRDIRAIRDAGVTVLVIEHNMRFVMGLCESITVLDQGEVICIGTPKEANSNPRVIEAYLGKEEHAHA